MSILALHPESALFMPFIQMKRTYIVTADYTVIDRAPLALEKGELVRVGKRDADWPGWVWVTRKDGRGSYVPEEVLQSPKEDESQVREAFKAHDLSVKRNDGVTSLREVKGWHWCSDADSNEGWLPSYLLVPVPVQA